MNKEQEKALQNLSDGIERLYATEDAKKYFPKGMPTFSQRAEFWAKNWEDWKDNELIVPSRKGLRDDLNYAVGYFNYSIVTSANPYTGDRLARIRFRTQEDLFCFTLKSSES